MTAKPIPDGYHAITPYLIVEGADKLMDFIKAAFGAKEMFRTTDTDGRIVHADVMVGDSHVMLAEAGGEWKAMPASIYLYVNDVDATYRQAVQAGATPVREVADQFYGDRTGGVKDTSGNYWWIATHKEDLSEEEVSRRAQAHMKQGTFG